MTDAADPSRDTDAVWRRAEIQSPCVKICMIHPGAGLCVGCHRTADEIAGWSRLSDAERAAVMADLPVRAERLRDPDARPSRRRRRQRQSETDG